MHLSKLALQINTAVSAHPGWKVRLRNAIVSMNSSLTPQDAARDDLCHVGVWPHGLMADEEVMSMPEFHAVMAKHSEFHGIAGRILGHALEGDRDRAQALMHAEFIPCSDELTRMLWRWKCQVRSEGPICGDALVPQVPCKAGLGTECPVARTFRLRKAA